MSGITGVYYLDGRPADHERSERMAATIAHRGPDRAGVWTEGPVGLGHRMLWSTPESLRERLPLADTTGNLVLTADARIDNREELAAALGISRNGEITDAELILGAYEKWGEGCPAMLLGDFAFAVWDGRKQLLFCARDRFGVKPFYYHQSDRLFAFGSEIKAVLSLPEVPRRLNELRVAEYLVGVFDDKAITFYTHVVRLLPAHTLTVSRQGVSVRPYWSLDPSRELRLRSDHEYAEAFREVFTEAVRCRLRSSHPVGSMLSGGLDSSSIVCVARQLLAQCGDRRLHTFSAIFDEVPQCDERPFINAVLAGAGLEPHYVHADRVSPLADHDSVLWHQDEAFFAPNLFMHRALYGAASRQGVRVLLDGLDGDTTVSHGAGFLAELARTGRWITLISEVNGLSRRFQRSAGSILWRGAIKPLVASEALRRVYRLRPGKRPTMIRPDFARRIHLADRRNGSTRAKNARQQHFQNFTHGFIPYLLEIADRAAAAFSIEPRYPFHDKRVAEFCLSLPPEQKLHHGWTRMVMRRAMDGILPVKVQWRGGKANLSQNFIRGLLTFERPLLENLIFHGSQIVEEYIDLCVLRKAYHQYDSACGSDDAVTVWKAANLAMWLRRTQFSAN